MAKPQEQQQVINIEELDYEEEKRKQQAPKAKAPKKTISAFYVRWVLMITGVVLAIALVFGGVSSLIEYNRNIGNEAKVIATAYATEAAQNLSDRLMALQIKVQNLAATIALAQPNQDELRDTLVDYAAHEEGIVRFRYRRPINNRIYDQVGVAVNHDFGDDFNNMVEKGEYGITGILNDPDLSIETICIGVPVSNYDEMDYLIAIYPVSQIIKDVNDIYGMALDCGKNAYAIGIYSSESLYCLTGQYPHAELDSVVWFSEYLDNLGTTADTQSRLRMLTRHYYASSIPFDAGIGSSVVAMAPTSYKGDVDLRIFAIYQISVISAGNYSFLAGMIVVLSAMSVLLITLVVYSVHCFMHRNKYEQYISSLDPVIGCNTYEHFCYAVSETYRKDPYTKFAVICLRFYYYHINTEDFGEEFMTGILKYTAQSIDRFMKANETFGVYRDGMFAINMTYKDEDELINRLKVLYTVLYNNPDMKQKSQRLRPQFGIYLGMTMGKADIQVMMQHASEAVLSNNTTADNVFLYYSDAAGETLRKEAEIESKMRGALANGDFKLFFQPLYNVESKTIDSAEVLVRWYDGVNGRYYMPSEFIQLFEVNGFITQVDRYVIREVFKLQKDNIQRHQNKIVLSVNVSSVTAVEDGFVQFCKDMHAQYEVPYDYVVFEFPEAFVYQNFDAMKRVMNDMKTAGFLCAVDGYGKAPYQVFKELSFYELKLDRYFLKPGRAKGVDDLLIENMIHMARSMNFKIVQEGVETHEDFRKLADMGIHAIQGYYYSKPLPYADYLDFANRATPFGI